MLRKAHTVTDAPIKAQCFEFDTGTCATSNRATGRGLGKWQ